FADGAHAPVGRQQFGSGGRTAGGSAHRGAGNVRCRGKQHWLLAQQRFAAVHSRGGLRVERRLFPAGSRMAAGKYGAGGRGSRQPGRAAMDLKWLTAAGPAAERNAVVPRQSPERRRAVSGSGAGGGCKLPGVCHGWRHKRRWRRASRAGVLAGNAGVLGGGGLCVWARSGANHAELGSWNLPLDADGGGAGAGVHWRSGRGLLCVLCRRARGRARWPIAPLAVCYAFAGDRSGGGRAAAAGAPAGLLSAAPAPPRDGHGAGHRGHAAGSRPGCPRVRVPHAADACACKPGAAGDVAGAGAV
ncbi:hypothetical protein IWW52_006707, partial [Coemansia sp. RSA 2704]